MSRTSTVRIAPARSGTAVASAWRIFAQGDEYYVAPRNMLQLGKLSFHRGFNWQQRLGGKMTRLSAPLKLSQGWLHAVQITFIIGTDTLRPIADTDSKLLLVEVPPHHKLVVNVLQHSQTRLPNMKPPTEVAGEVIAHDRLRSGASLLTVARVMPTSEHDELLASDIRAKLRVNIDTPPHPSEVFVEAMWQEFSPTTGNAIAVIPVGPESLAGPK